MSEQDADRSQIASLSTSARAYLVTIETMRRLVEQIAEERDELAAQLVEIRAKVERIERRERVARFRRKRGRA